MSKRTITLGMIAALLGFLALLVTTVFAGSQASAASSCAVGQITYGVYSTQPGDAWMQFDTANRPAGCYSISAMVESNQQHKLGFGGKYTAGWVKNPGPVSKAQVPSAANGDGSGVYKAWERKEPSGTPSKRECRRVYPTVGSWYGCAPKIRTTAAVSQHWTYPKLRAALSGAGPYLICAKYASKTLQRMGAYYELAKPRVDGKACPASRQWEWYEQGYDYNGVPQGNFKAVGDGWWLASSKFCAWTVRHSDRKTSGTLWKLFLDKKNNFYIANAKCSGVDDHGLPRYDKVMTTDNRPTSQWFIADRNHPNRGDYTHLILQIPPSHVRTTAAVRRTPTCSGITVGPWNLRTQSGTHAPYAGFFHELTPEPIESSEGRHGTPKSRYFYFDQTGCASNGRPEGYFDTAVGFVASATTKTVNGKVVCTGGWTLKPSRNNDGTVTILHIGDNAGRQSFEFAPRACNPNWKHGDDPNVLASDDVSGHRLRLVDNGSPHPGWFWKWSLPRAPLTVHTTALVTHHSQSRECLPGPSNSPYRIKYTNASKTAPYVYLDNARPLAPAKSYKTGWLFRWHGLGCIKGGSPYGYWLDYKNQVLASNNDCTKWVVKGSTADSGTITILLQRTNPDGSIYTLLASRYCNGQWKSGKVTKIWASLDIRQHNLVLFDLEHPKNGYYLKVDFIHPSHARTTALVRATCSAECISWDRHAVSGGSVFGSWWTQNRYGMRERARARCVNPRTGEGDYNYGSWKTDLNQPSQATCYKPDTMTYGCYQQQATPSSPLGTTCPYHPASKITTTALVKPAPVAHRSCLNLPECLYINGSRAQIAWVQVQWLNNQDFWFARPVAKCGNGTRNTILEVGSWVSALNTPSEVDCTSGYPDLAGAAYDWKDEEAGSTYTRHWVTVSFKRGAVHVQHE